MLRHLRYGSTGGQGAFAVTKRFRDARGIPVARMLLPSRPPIEGGITLTHSSRSNPHDSDRKAVNAIHAARQGIAPPREARLAMTQGLANTRFAVALQVIVGTRSRLISSLGTALPCVSGSQASLPDPCA